MIKAIISGEKITSNSPEAFTLYEKSRFGEKKKNKIEFMPVEALHLQELNKAEVFSNNKLLNEEQLIKKLRIKDKKIETKLAAFKDLRKKGYILKTALKFGAEFRVYEKGVFPGKDHARWLIYTTQESEKINWHDFAAKNRIAHSTKKHLLLAIVDEEEDVTYYQVNWLKP
jgi:tRNA-intron endonuclease, archaea type